MGVLSPLGIGLEANWDAISNGRSGIGPVTKFDASDLPSRIAGEVRNFNGAWACWWARAWAALKP